MTVEKAYHNYRHAAGTGRRFRNFALSAAMDWELTAAVTYPMLQAGYESLHPWRTGKAVENWRVTKGDRFVALTSYVPDVLLMHGAE